MRRSLVAALVAASILAGGAVGVIVGATSVPTIKACVTKTTNVLRYTTAGCATGEKLLTWNVRGPQGPAGPTGAQGPQGAQGPAGSGGGGSSAGNPFWAVDGPSTTFIAGTNLVSLKVPAGGYLIDFAATLSPTDTTKPPVGDCVLTTNATWDPGMATALAHASFGGSTSVALRGFATFSVATTIYGQCQASPGAKATDVRLIATAAARQPALP